ncbi:MAG TPA: cytochrome d ubiquinol oxidase subunit II [Tepidisphaeraceae bacterium]|nr:cytochrome d ubiquinol oxidase subunit II [Tepidisphaeraceae bacterium]
MITSLLILAADVAPIVDDAVARTGAGADPSMTAGDPRPLLCVAWFLLLGVLLAGYAILDGFDLGVGILHPFVPKDDTERRVSLNAIGPVWDGNEVWLVTFGGAMFAMFPYAYASIFSGFYTAFMLLLLCLIFRAVSIEFRGKMKSQGAKRAWDVGFFAGSAGATLLFGVAVGNALRGLAIDAEGTFTGGLFDQLHPYTLLTGALAVALFAMHGAIFLHLKAEGEYHERLRHTMWTTFGLFLVLYLLVTMYTLAEVPRAVANFRAHPWLWVVPVLNVLAIANIPRAIYQDRPKYAFVSSCATILAFVFLLMAALFPNMVSATDPANDISIYDAASSNKTLVIGLIIVALGMPFVVTYTAIIYWTFRGKVRLDPHSY